MRRVRRLRRTREWRPEITVAPERLADLPPERGMWHETPEDAALARARAKEKARLLRWTRQAMQRRLTAQERRLVALYYFEGLTLKETAQRRRTHPSTVSRALRRAVRKLRVAAEEEGVGKCEV